MELAGKIVVVTGGAQGIGRALCLRFAAEGARGVVVADLDAHAARATANECGGLAVACDVTRNEDLRQLVSETEAAWGPIDLFCSNAGVLGPAGGLDLDDDAWHQVFAVNYWAHLAAARVVVPGMLARGGGYLLQTCSAAGLLTQIGAAPYAVSKHAAVALAEWLAVTYGDRGLKVSCLCPQGVRTRMLEQGADARGNKLGQFLVPGALDPAVVAEVVVAGLAVEKFLILPHAEVGEFYRRKGDDPDRWLRGMRRLQQQLQALAE